MPLDLDLVFAPVLLLVGVTLTMVAVYHALAGPDKDHAQLQEWAQRNRCRVTSRERRYLRKGPFWMSSRAQRVYRIGVIDESGRTREGYARFGSYWWGMQTKDICFSWDQDAGAG